MSWRTRVLAVLTALAAVAVAVPADAAVIWDGDAARGTGVFGQLNCDAPGTVDDATHGKVWRYHKPSGDRRCETHGISTGNGKYAFHNGSTYTISAGGARCPAR